VADLHPRNGSRASTLAATALAAFTTTVANAGLSGVVSAAGDFDLHVDD